MSKKFCYKFMSIFLPVSALSLVFVLRFSVKFITENFSEKSSMIIILTFCVFMMIYVLGMAFGVDRMRKKYYADESFWQPEVLKLPNDCENVDFLKNKLKEQGFDTFSVRQGEQWYDYIVVYYKKYKYMEPVCVVFIDGDRIKEDYKTYVYSLSEKIRENDSCKEKEIYETSKLIPIIYTKNSKDFKDLTKESLYGGRFDVYPCIADFSLKELFVTKFTVHGMRYVRKDIDLTAVNIMAGILNSTDDTL